MSLPPFSLAECKAETFSRPRVDIFQYQDSPISIDLRWLGGVANGAEIACAVLAGCGLGNISLVINSMAAEEQSATLGVTAEVAIAAIRRCVAAKAERAA